jgi:phosphoribosylformimino-5-aminoimidazole carboxamide ribonucleotide (ProFAR) isomerase
MLIIPTIRLHDRTCRHLPRGAEGTDGLYPTHPELIVRMWRGENAKSLAIIDENGLVQGGISCADLVAAMTAATDIPVILFSGFSDDDDVQKAFDRLGCYRVVLPDNVCTPERIGRLLAAFGPRRIAVSMQVEADAAGAPVSRAVSPLLARLGTLEQAGLERITLLVGDGSGPPPRALLIRIVHETRLAVTLRNSVREYSDLDVVQRLSPRRIDSLMLDDVLYDNAFPCQRIWRLAERQLIEEGRLT